MVLSTFIHLSPDLAAPLLLDIMQSVGRYIFFLLLWQYACLGSRIPDCEEMVYSLLWVHSLHWQLQLSLDKPEDTDKCV